MTRTMPTIPQGVRVRYESVGSTAVTLENLVKSERSQNQNHATGCLARLIRYVPHSKGNLSFINVIHTRGLSLTCKALQHMQKDANAELYTCFQRSYDQVLRPHHSWVVSSIVYVSHFSWKLFYSDYELFYMHLYPLHHNPYFISSEPCTSIVISRFPVLMATFLHLHGQTWWPSHPWLTTNTLIQLAIRSVPHRRDFYARLLQGGDPEKFDTELAKWLAALDEIVKHMSEFLEHGGFGRVWVSLAGFLSSYMISLITNLWDLFA
jgi:hypothetical protein